MYPLTSQIIDRIIFINDSCARNFFFYRRVRDILLYRFFSTLARSSKLMFSPNVNTTFGLKINKHHTCKNKFHLVCSFQPQKD